MGKFHLLYCCSLVTGQTPNGFIHAVNELPAFAFAFVCTLILRKLLETISVNFIMSFCKTLGLVTLSFTLFLSVGYSSDIREENLADHYKDVLAAANEVDLRELPNSSLRILWIRSFHEPVIFTLSKSKDTHLIVTKTLAAADGADKSKIKSVYSNEINETHANYVYQTLTKTCGFFTLPEQLPPISMDGSTIVIELNTGGSYHVVETQSIKSSDCINKLSRLVLVLSGVDFHPIY